MITGSCLCKAVQFELDEAGIAASVGCHCANCRKVSGSQYGVYLQVRPRSFRWISGQDEVARYQSSPGNDRGFCRKCGSVAPLATAYGAIRVPGGALDADPGRGPDVVLFTRARAPWCGLDGAEQQFEDSGPPEFWQGMIARLYRP